MCRRKIIPAKSILSPGNLFLLDVGVIMILLELREIRLLDFLVGKVEGIFSICNEKRWPDDINSYKETNLFYKPSIILLPKTNKDTTRKESLGLGNNAYSG